MCPGVIDTPILGPAHGVPELIEGPLARVHPLGRVGQPDEVANLVVYLASDKASFTTGVAYPIDGGIMATLGGGGDDALTEETAAVLAKMGNDSANSAN